MCTFLFAINAPENMCLIGCDSFSQRCRSHSEVKPSYVRGYRLRPLLRVFMPLLLFLFGSLSLCTTEEPLGVYLNISYSV